MTKSGSALAAVFTPRGRGAVATIVCRDALHLLDQQSPPLFQAANQKKFVDQKINQVLFGQWGDVPSEDVVVCRIDESTLEIHCHGGQAAVNRILSGLESIGSQVVTWQEFDRKLKGNFHSEIQNALAHAQTCKTAAILLNQQSGCLEIAIQDLIEKVEALQSQFEESTCQQLQQELQLLINNSELGRHLVEPFQVVLAGKPNVGKSSLINALVGYDRSIVYDMPGTTRDAVSTETAFNGWPVELTDTAGLRQTADELESAGIEIARNKLQQADCRILLFDVSQPLTADDVELHKKWPDSILVAHKCDLADLPEALKQRQALPVSSTEMTGIVELVEILQQKLVPHEPESGTPFPFTERQVNLLNTAEDSIIKQEWEAALKALKELIS